MLIKPKPVTASELPRYNVAPLEISVVYYHGGYVPGDYALPVGYSTRSVVERSRAAQCPSIAHMSILRPPCLPTSAASLTKSHPAG